MALRRRGWPHAARCRNPTSELNNGVYVDAGPVTYQLQISRELNQYAVEDRQYLTRAARPAALR